MVRQAIKTLCVFFILIGLFSGCSEEVVSPLPVKTPPVAGFEADPIAGTLSTVFTFDAGVSNDQQSTADQLEIRWDWDNDGEYDTSWDSTKVADHQFTTVGMHEIRLQVRDTDLMLSNFSDRIYVGSDLISNTPVAQLVVLSDSSSVVPHFRFDAGYSYDLETPPDSLEVRWQFGHSFTAWTQNKAAYYTFETPGTKEVQLEVRDQDGNVGECSKIINVEIGTIHVPFDVESIQQAVTWALPGDTVLVAPGTYYENLYLNDMRDLVIASYELKSHSASVIEETIIDGGGAGPVVAISRTVESSVIFRGFTIQNGQVFYSSQHSSNGGAGIRVDGPVHLTNLIVRNNQAVSHVGFGAGISISGDPLIENTIIYGNSATWKGGGLFVGQWSEPVVRNCIIVQNQSQSGGGIYCQSWSDLGFSQVTVADNHASTRGGGVYYGNNRTDILFQQSILWGNTPDMIEGIGNLYLPGYFFFECCNLQAELGNVSDSCIFTDPLFVDVEDHQYGLSPDSPAANQDCGLMGFSP